MWIFVASECVNKFELSCGHLSASFVFISDKFDFQVALCRPNDATSIPIRASDAWSLHDGSLCSHSKIVRTLLLLRLIACLVFSVSLPTNVRGCHWQCELSVRLEKCRKHTRKGQTRRHAHAQSHIHYNFRVENQSLSQNWFSIICRFSCARRPLETQFICSFDLHDAAVAFNAFCRHISIAFMDDWSHWVCAPNATAIQKIHEIKQKKTRQKLKPVASTGHLSERPRCRLIQLRQLKRKGKNKNFAWLKTRSFDLIEVRYVVRYIRNADEIRRPTQKQKQNSLFSSLRRSHTPSIVHTNSIEVLAARQPASQFAVTCVNALRRVFCLRKISPK